MKVTYIFHSGFIVETESRYYIFDYYKGDIPPLDNSKKAIVFASHAHEDHYNSEIFSILSEMEIDHTAVLAKDISSKKYPFDTEVLKAYANKTYSVDGIEIETLLSTDAGVAYIVRDPEGVIYHAGDLNDWTWHGEPEQWNKQMTGSYRHEINKLAGMKIDIAFVVLDPRQEENYDRGMLYFLKKANADKIFPMHYWEKPDVIDRFNAEHPEYSDKIMYTENQK